VEDLGEAVGRRVVAHLLVRRALAGHLAHVADRLLGGAPGLVGGALAGRAGALELVLHRGDACVELRVAAGRGARPGPPPARPGTRATRRRPARALRTARSPQPPRLRVG